MFGHVPLQSLPNEGPDGHFAVRSWRDALLGVRNGAGPVRVQSVAKDESFLSVSRRFEEAVQEWRPHLGPVPRLVRGKADATHNDRGILGGLKYLLQAIGAPCHQCDVGKVQGGQSRPTRRRRGPGHGLNCPVGVLFRELDHQRGADHTRGPVHGHDLAGGRCIIGEGSSCSGSDGHFTPSGWGVEL